MTCRFCRTLLTQSFVDLGHSPLANAYLTQEQCLETEKFYPLHAYVCTKCWLVQLPNLASSEELFAEYLYFSSYSESWLQHAQNYVKSMLQRFQLNAKDFVIEVASNDGYLLQYFCAENIPALGIEPAQNIAQIAQAKGVPTESKFLGHATAQQLMTQYAQADLLIANNVLAHVPDLHDFILGLKTLLKAEGVLTLEFPHLLRLIQEQQFDTIYHEHFSYFSCLTVQQILKAHDLRIFDIEHLETHGGSLRLYVCHHKSHHPQSSEVLQACLQAERDFGLNQLHVYQNFAPKVQNCKKQFLNFLSKAKADGRHVVAYGAPAKGNTLLNYCDVTSDLLAYTVDRSPHKQGHYLPGTHLEIHAPEKIFESQPDYLVILPWNLTKEIISQMQGIRTWGGKFVVPIPKLKVFS